MLSVLWTEGQALEVDEARCFEALENRLSSRFALLWVAVEKF